VKFHEAMFHTGVGKFHKKKIESVIENIILIQTKMVIVVDGSKWLTAEDVK
jgi:hypothetical protein